MVISFGKTSESLNPLALISFFTCSRASLKASTLTAGETVLDGGTAAAAAGGGERGHPRLADNLEDQAASETIPTAPIFPQHAATLHLRLGLGIDHPLVAFEFASSRRPLVGHY